METSLSGSAKAVLAAPRILARLRSASARLVGDGFRSEVIKVLSGQAIRKSIR